MERRERRKCKCIEHTGDEGWHGATGYSYHACRCPTCVSGSRRYQREWRAANPAKVAEYESRRTPQDRVGEGARYYQQNRQACLLRVAKCKAIFQQLETPRAGAVWTDEEDRIVTTHSELRGVDLALRLGRTPGAIYARLNRLRGLAADA